MRPECGDPALSVPDEVTGLIHRVRYPVVSLGRGSRVGIWFQGCSRACPGCMASETWDLDERYRVGLSEVVALLKTCATKDPDGVTISGGEPFAQPDMLRGVLEACRDLAYREVLVYTGFSLEECRQQYSAILSLIDILITDPFVEGLPTDKIWRGSDNQRLTLLSERAGEKYHGRDLDTELRPVDDIPLQMEIFEDFVEVIGIPRRGDVRRIQAAIRKGGSS